MATAEVSIIGLGRQSASASKYIAEMQRRLQAQDKVRFKLNAMGTELEGRLEDILDVVRQLHNVPFEAGLPRVYTVLKIDERLDKPTQPRWSRPPPSALRGTATSWSRRSRRGRACRSTSSPAARRRGLRSSVRPSAWALPPRVRSS